MSLEYFELPHNIKDIYKPWCREEFLRNIQEKLAQASSQGNLEMLKYGLHSKDLPINGSVIKGKYVKEIVKHAVINNHFNIISHVLTKEGFDIHLDNDGLFRTACDYGNLDMVKYLTSSHELKEHANIHVGNDHKFFWLCSDGQKDLIEYLLHYPKPQNFSSFKKMVRSVKNVLNHEKYNYGLKTILQGMVYAAKEGQMDTFTYLCELPFIKNKLNKKSDWILKAICDEGFNQQAVQVLLQYVEVNDKIYKKIDEDCANQLKLMSGKKNLLNNLNENLDKKSSPVKVKKI